MSFFPVPAAELCRSLGRQFFARLALTCAAGAALPFAFAGAAEPAAHPSTEPASTRPASTRPASAEELPPGAVLRLGSGRFQAGQPCVAAAFSPDSAVFASLYRDGRICLWDAATGSRTASLNGESLPADAGFTADGKTLIVATTSGAVQFWDLATGAVARTERSPGAVNRLAVSPDGRFFATGGPDVRLWDLRADKGGAADETGPRRLGTNGPSTSVIEFSSDGKTLMSAGLDSTVRLWDFETGKQRLVINVGFGTSGFSASLSADGKVVATGAGGSVRLWDAASGARLPRPRFNGGGSSGGSVTFAPVGGLLAVDRRAGFITVWDLATGRDVWNLPTGYPGPGGAFFSPDGKKVAGLIDGEIEMWDVATGKPLFPRPPHRAPLTAVATSPDGRWVATGDTLGKVAFWDVSAKPGADRAGDPGSRGRLANLPLRFGGLPTINALRFSADGQTLWVRHPSAVEVIALAAGRSAKRFEALNTVANPEVALSADGQLLALATGASGNRDLMICDASAMKLLRRLPAEKHIAQSLAFAPEGSELAAALDGKVKVWDAASGALVRDLDAHNEFIRRVAYSPDGRFLAGSGQTGVYLWGAADGKPHARLDPPNEKPAGNAEPAGPQAGRSAGAPRPARARPAPGALAFSPDGRLIALAAGEGVDVFEASTGGHVAHLRGHQGGTTALAFLPDPLRLVTAGLDAGALVWDLRSALPPPDPQTARFPRLLLDDLWKKLDSEDAADGYAAVAALSVRPADAIGMLTERLAEPEARTPRRAERALAALEIIGSDEARKALRELAAAPVGAAAGAAAAGDEKPAPVNLPREASAALKRLDRHPFAPTPQPPSADIDTAPAPMAYANPALVHPVAAAPATPATRDGAPPAARDAEGPGSGAAAGPATAPAFRKARVPAAPAVAPPAVPEASILQDPQAVRRLATEGDPSVLATLSRWLHEGAAEAEIGTGSPQFRAGIELLGWFPVEAEVPTLVGVYNNPTADVTMREAAAVAVARVGTPAVKDFLTDALNGDTLGFRGRLLVAAALVRLDSDAARDVLFDEYQEYLDAFDGGFTGNEWPRKVLATLGDAKLIDRLLAAADKQSTVTAANNIRTLVEGMRLNALPPERLREFAADGEWQHADRRYGAILALGRKGDRATIPFLQSLAPWPAGSGGDNSIQQGNLTSIRDQAVADLRRSHWAEGAAGAEGKQ